MYFITTLRICGNIIDDCRTVGMNNSYGYCYHNILNNAMDIFESNYYQYAIITFIEEGIYPKIVEQQWFKYDNNTIITCERPKEIGDYQLYIIG